MPLLSLAAIRSAMEKVEAVSFDVFDTLIERSVAEPADVFDLLAQDNADGFREARVRAESVARSLRADKDRHSEVTLNEIYENLSRRTFERVSPEMELEAEARLIRPRPLGVRMLQLAKTDGKAIFAVSDSYLSSRQIRDLLEQKGILVDRVFSSSETAGGKYDGRLYAQLLAESGLAPSQILHIGDNREADFHSALKAGIRAIHIPSALELLFRDEQYNSYAIQDVRKTGSLLASFVLARTARLREAEELTSATLRYAHMYGGPLIFSFCSWLAERAKEDGVTKLLLMARDGYIVRDALAILYPEIDVEVLQLSRRAVIVPSLPDNPVGFEIVFPYDGRTPLGEVLRSVFTENTEAIMKGVAAAGFDLRSPISRLTALVKLRAAILLNKHLIDEQVSRERIGVKRYAEAVGIPGDHVAIVDTGWALSSHRALDCILGSKQRGYYLGCNDHAYRHGQIHFMLASSDPASGWHPIVHSAVELLELAFLSDEDQVERVLPTETGFRIEMRPASATEASRRPVAHDLRQGVLAFCRDAKEMHLKVGKKDHETALLALFTGLTSHPTRGEYLTLGEILHDRYLHDGRYFDFGSFWRAASKPQAEPTFPLPERRGRTASLARRFFDLFRIAGPLVALRRARKYLRRRHF